MKKSVIFMIMFLVVFSFLQIAAQTWSLPKRLTWTIGTSYQPSIASDSGTGIHVVWSEFKLTDLEIYYKRSMDGGTTWSIPTRLTWNVGNSNDPSIAADSGTGIHVVWRDDSFGNPEIFYKHSSDSGATWSRVMRLTWNAGDTYPSCIAAGPGNMLHLVWYDNFLGGLNIFYKRSTDSGASWSTTTPITWSSGAMRPVIAADSGTGVHIVWDYANPINTEIGYKRSMDSGVTWSILNRLTWTSSNSLGPAVSAGPGNWLHVSWTEELPSPAYMDIFFKSSADGGVTWSVPIRLTWNTGESSNPSLAADSGSDVHLVWNDTTPGNFEVFYKMGSKGGVSWSVPTRLTWNPGESGATAIAIDSTDGVHVIWQDNSPGNYEIYYKNRK